MELIHGRPADPTGRLDKELRCYDLLDALHIDYDRTDHKSAGTMEACREIDAILGAFICKNLFLCNRQQTQFYLLMIGADKPFHTKDLSGQIGSSRLSFAPAEKMEEYLDITPGSVSVLGLMNDKENKVRLLIDRPLLDSLYFGCHPCVNTVSLRLKTRDLLDRILPAIHHEPMIVDLPDD